jgi:hypothetical protein
MSPDPASPAAQIILRPTGKVRHLRRVLLPTPAQIAARVAAIPRGQTLTLPALKAAMAAALGADLCCPVTTRRALAALVTDDSLPLWRLLLPGDITVRQAGLSPRFAALLAEETPP